MLSTFIVIISSLVGSYSVRAQELEVEVIGMGCLIGLVLNVDSFLFGSISKLVLSISMNVIRRLAFRT